MKMVCYDKLLFLSVINDLFICTLLTSVPGHMFCSYFALFVVVLCPLGTVFQLYHGSVMMYEKTRRNPEPTPLLTQWIFNLPHRVGMVWEELVFDDAVSYTQRRKWIAAQLNVMPVTRIRSRCPQGYIPHTLTNWANSPAPLHFAL